MSLRNQKFPVSFVADFRRSEPGSSGGYSVKSQFRSVSKSARPRNPVGKSQLSSVRDCRQDEIYGKQWFYRDNGSGRRTAMPRATGLLCMNELVVVPPFRPFRDSSASCTGCSPACLPAISWLICFLNNELRNRSE